MTFIIDLLVKILTALGLLKPRIPYPEEPPDYGQTVDNVRAQDFLDLWITRYQVPIDHINFWLNSIEVDIDPNLSYPAATWEQNGKRHLAVRPEWLNAGVIAHEQAHNSYALLSGEQKVHFAQEHDKLKRKDRLVRHIYSRNPYGLTSDVEGHAEIYRYIGVFMADDLKQFYPGLF